MSGSNKHPANNYSLPEFRLFVMRFCPTPDSFLNVRILGEISEHQEWP